jgi:hypothetical protein
MKIVLVPEKDVADSAVKQGDNFRKWFLSRKKISLYDFKTLNLLKTIF